MPPGVEKVLRAYRKVVVPEMNLGQLALLLRGLFLVDAISVNQVHGLPFRIDSLAASIRSVLEGTFSADPIGTAGAFGTHPTIRLGMES